MKRVKHCWARSVLTWVQLTPSPRPKFLQPIQSHLFYSTWSLSTPTRNNLRMADTILRQLVESQTFRPEKSCRNQKHVPVCWFVVIELGSLFSYTCGFGWKRFQIYLIGLMLAKDVHPPWHWSALYFQSENTWGKVNASLPCWWKKLWWFQWFGNRWVFLIY